MPSKRLLISSLLLLGLASVAHAESLSELQEMGQTILPNAAVDSNLRYDALRSTAIGLGTRGGLAERSVQINAELQGKADALDKVYSFRRLMISAPAGQGGTSDYTILPPVIEQSNDIYEVDDDTRIRIADVAYDILTQARFVSVPPSWRDYLQMLDTGAVEHPHPSMLPRDDKERALWRDWIKQGWSLGAQQADAILQENLARLQRDFRGIVKYRELLAEGKVSRPYVAQSDAGIRGNDTNMLVGERLLRITSTPSLVRDSAKWRPIVRPAAPQAVTDDAVAAPVQPAPAVRLKPQRAPAQGVHVRPAEDNSAVELMQ